MHHRVYVCALAFVTEIGCTTSSPLVESSPQIELTTNPGHVAGQAPLELTLTTWNHLAALGDAVDANQLVATIDGASLAIDRGSTGYFGNGDRYVAAFTTPAVRSTVDQMSTGTSSTVAITDQQTTWSFQAANLMTNDLQPTSPIVAGQANIVSWPSAAQPDHPATSIAWACVQIADRSAACLGDGKSDPGIAIAQQFITIDVPAATGDAYTVWAARTAVATDAGDSSQVIVTVLDQVTGVFQ